MRAAERVVRDSLLGQELLNRSDQMDAEIIFYLINEARKEAIEECAEIAFHKVDHQYSAPEVENAILELINELK